MNDIIGKQLKFWLVVSYLVGIANSTSCPPEWPCNQELRCNDIDTSNCEHGIVLDTCYCCHVCGKGPGELCGRVEGNCGEGLVCDYVSRDVGLCIQAEGTSTESSTESSTTAPTGARAASTSPMATAEEEVTNTIEPATEEQELQTTSSRRPTEGPDSREDQPLTANCTTPPPSTTTTTTRTTEVCRNKCSMEQCSDAIRHRLCSAEGMEFSKVAERGKCQHTSCRSCFLQVQPDCTNICPEPPTKSCLKQYSNCIRDYLFGTSVLLLRLDDPAARNYVGRIVCHVAPVSTTA